MDIQCPFVGQVVPTYGRFRSPRIVGGAVRDVLSGVAPWEPRRCNLMQLGRDNYKPVLFIGVQKETPPYQSTREVFRLANGSLR